MVTGSLVPNITIFDEQGNLDIESTKWHMGWMFERGLDGLFLTGSYGSGPLMTNAERIEVFEAAKEVAAGFENKYILAHVGCIDTASTIELAKAADAIGVDVISAVPPFYYKHTEDEIVKFYQDIIENVNTPVYAYNNPGTSRFTFSFGTVKRLQELGLKGMKDSPLNVGFISRVYYDAKQKEKDYQVVLGTSTGWLPFYQMGVRATVAGMNNWAPEVMTELVQASFAGDEERAQKAYLVMLDLSAKMHFTESTIVSHMGLYARGYDAGFPRKPKLLPPLGDPKYQEVREIIKGGFAELGLEFE